MTTAPYTPPLNRLPNLCLLLCILLAAAPQLLAQESAGNGVLINALAMPITVAVQPKSLGQSAERQFELLPGTRLLLQNHSEYSIFVLKENAVYDVNVARRTATGTSTRHFFYLDDTQGKSVIKKGLPSRLFERAQQTATQSTEQTTQNWMVHSGNSHKTLAPVVQRRLMLEKYAVLINQQTGIECAPLISGDKLVLLVAACDEQWLQMAGERIKSQIEKFPIPVGLPPLVSQVLPLCCTASSVDYATIVRLTSSTPVEPLSPPKVFEDPASSSVYLGSFTGLDDSKSELDMLASEVRRLEYLLRNGDFQYVQPWQSQLKQCLSFEACLLTNNQGLSEEELYGLRMGLRERLRQIYVCALTSRNNNAPSSDWSVTGIGYARAPLNVNFDQDEQGNVVKYNFNKYSYSASNASVASQLNSYNITVVLKGIDEVKVRGCGWCMLERLKGLTLNDKWEVVAPGPDSYGWLNSKYCVQVRRGDQVKVFDAFFEPRANKTWVFSFDRWETK